MRSAVVVLEPSRDLLGTGRALAAKILSPMRIKDVLIN
jgi:hypothetical protein